ncbi:MAG: UDP-N-acetylmuramoyl-tripeptide--D-alanyl-D-alanine ligase [Clostridium sp.]|nr:UDP-N-acetylmuramoyl-tripeptide--D-alanyl-D-alanine ligase [Clostridium sp.]MDY3827875.1 UDP-N-acetylmuramoyl-tripeptide--D-alanyl-D-alanine ligase [Clostridium sp.]
MEISFDELLEAVNGIVIQDSPNKKFNEVSIDTRKIQKGNIFLALKGENFNGNNYVKQAFEKGATIAIVDEDVFNYLEIKDMGVVIKVKNGNKALLSLAKFYREKLGIKVIGITGSTGKTSTKDITAALLSEKYKVFKTKGNFNNNIGLPLMILQLDSSYDVAVLELGMSNLMEIHTLANCARPDIALITNIGISHIENLKTQDNIFKAKMEITDFFTDKNTLIVNSEDKYLNKVSSSNYKVVKTGINTEAELTAYDIRLFEDTTIFSVNINGAKQEFTLNMVGQHNVLNAMLGIGAALELGVNVEEMKKGLANIENTSMRLEFIKNDKFTIINDCYNASPDSMKAALDVLNNSSIGRKVAILGTMNELGEESNKAHTEVGAYAKDKADLLVVTGAYKDAYKEGYSKDSIIIYETKEELIKDISNHIEENDVILVKASRGIKYEEIVEKLKML